MTTITYEINPRSIFDLFQYIKYWDNTCGLVSSKSEWTQNDDFRPARDAAEVDRAIYTALIKKYENYDNFLQQFLVNSFGKVLCDDDMKNCHTVNINIMKYSIDTLIRLFKVLEQMVPVNYNVQSDSGNIMHYYSVKLSHHILKNILKYFHLYTDNNHNNHNNIKRLKHFIDIVIGANIKIDNVHNPTNTNHWNRIINQLGGIIAVIHELSAEQTIKLFELYPLIFKLPSVVSSQDQSSLSYDPKLANIRFGTSNNSILHSLFIPPAKIPSIKKYIDYMVHVPFYYKNESGVYFISYMDPYNRNISGDSELSYQIIKYIQTRYLNLAYQFTLAYLEGRVYFDESMTKEERIKEYDDFISTLRNYYDNIVSTTPSLFKVDDVKSNESDEFEEYVSDYTGSERVNTLYKEKMIEVANIAMDQALNDAKKQYIKNQISVLECELAASSQ